MRREYRSMYDLTNIVQTILRLDPKTRDDDNLLHVRVLQRIDPTLIERSYAEIMLNRESYKIPTVESTGRARRKLQRQFPELRGKKEVEDARYEKWKEMRDYAAAEIEIP